MTHTMRLLVVEDSPQDRQLFECLVEDFRRECAVRIDCEQAGSGPQALALIDRQGYDAVILDQHMPEMSGSEVRAALRGRFLNRSDRPKVLAYSTLDSPEFRRQCLAEGADTFMSRCMDASELACAIRELGLGVGFSDKGKPT